MTSPKRPQVVIPPLPKAVPYPPDSIWRAWPDQEHFSYRGNTFKRDGLNVSRVFPEKKADAMT